MTRAEDKCGYTFVLERRGCRVTVFSFRLTEFIKKMKSWLAMSHFDEGFCRRVDLLERNFAVSNNIFKKYKPIFLDLFKNPANDLPRAPRSRKQRRPPCNSTELFHFCWTLYILIKGQQSRNYKSMHLAGLNSNFKFTFKCVFFYCIRNLTWKLLIYLLQCT